VVFDVVAIGAVNVALGDFRLDNFDRNSHSNHVPDVEGFFLVLAVMELKSAVITEPATNTLQGLLVIVDPNPQLCAARALGGDFARSAAVDAIADPSADLECGFGLRLLANPARRRGLSLRNACAIPGSG
jgi:hypothetical protein